MNIIIDSVTTSKIPHFKIGCIIYHNITVSDSPQSFKEKFQSLQKELFEHAQLKEIMDFPGIKEWRDTFKLAGTDASRYRHSAEALYRRIKKQNFLEPIHSAIDVNNFFSLLYECPLGIYDLDKIVGHITFSIGTDGDLYEGINGRINNMKNIILSKDETGAFGSPYIDSKRTMVTTDTKNAIQFIYLLPSYTLEEANEITATVMNEFLEMHGGQGQYKILT